MDLPRCHLFLARGVNLADFIQPSLVQLQPNLDEFMDIEPLHGNSFPFFTFP